MMTSGKYVVNGVKEEHRLHVDFILFFLSLSLSLSLSQVSST